MTKIKKTSKKTSAKVSKKAVKKKNFTSIDRLISLLSELEEHEIAFLIKQASVMIKNKEIEKRNKTVIKNINDHNKKVKNKQVKSKKELKVEIEEKPSGNSFIIIINSSRNFMTIEEMRKIVKICHSSKDNKDASKRMYVWFQNFRSDVLYDSVIDSPAHPSLTKLYNIIIKTYRPKDS